MSCSRLHTFGILCDVCERLEDARTTRPTGAGFIDKGLDMDRLIVHMGTGTILRASECVVVDADSFSETDIARLSDDEYFDDGVICEIAERCGVAL